MPEDAVDEIVGGRDGVSVKTVATRTLKVITLIKHNVNLKLSNQKLMNSIQGKRGIESRAG